MGAGSYDGGVSTTSGPHPPSVLTQCHRLADPEAHDGSTGQDERRVLSPLADTGAVGGARTNRGRAVSIGDRRIVTTGWRTQVSREHHAVWRSHTPTHDRIGVGDDAGDLAM